ncbi:MAG: discoidin domain-containing protein [Planctomycetes bacterium]|nr:discoidin domain-containing protein [Planctomycetota bacterium]
MLSHVFSLLCSFSAANAPAVAPAPRPIEFAVIESSCSTEGSHIRQFAFDANPNTYFASERNAAKSDHLTLTFDQPVSLKTVSVLTGTPNNEFALRAATLEVSTQGTDFESVATFADGKAEWSGNGKLVKAVRVRVIEDLKHPLVVREITLDSDPKVVTFRYPIEFTLDVKDAPEMKEWGQKVVRICEREYAMICDELSSEGFRPLTQIHLSLKSDYNGVAAAGGGRITGSVKYFKAHPGDIGAMVHETVHCVQNYRARNLPGWLVEGIADYVRFWKYEPGKAGRLTPERANYDASYRTTAAFLAFVSANYDPKTVTKLNALLRADKYDAGVWKTLTGKSVEELNQEWKRSLAR